MPEKKPRRFPGSAKYQAAVAAREAAAKQQPKSEKKKDGE